MGPTSKGSGDIGREGRGRRRGRQRRGDRVATSLGEKNSRTFQGHSSTFPRPISATFYCDAGILKVIA